VRDRRILILGGTREARELATLLAVAGARPTTALAGITTTPAELAGEVRRGGFGGVEGLTAYLASEAFDAIVDATHPFAARISMHAAEAAAVCGITIMRLERQPWQAGPKDRWSGFEDCETAAAAITGGERVMLTVGRKELAQFTSRPGLAGVARMIEPPTAHVPASWSIICARPPFAFADELALMEREQITLLVAKNSGGDRAKLDAARERGIPVYLIERPRKPDLETVVLPEAMLALLVSHA
jgi:precorrin-6A/cobalt-precorrin-6A reductase